MPRACRSMKRGHDGYPTVQDNATGLGVRNRDVKLDDSDEALDLFNRALDRWPDNALLLAYRGFLKQDLGRGDALADFEQAAARQVPLAAVYAALAKSSLAYRSAAIALPPELCSSPREADVAALA